MTFDDYYQQLNKNQQEAVDTIEGPLLILAGPGTGKTQLLSVRTANILKQTDVYPSNILILTYTNAGVKVMRERIATMIGQNGYDVIIDTFHGFANTLISESEEASAIKGERIQLTDLERIYLIEYLLDTLEGIDAIRHAHAPYLYRQELQTNISKLKRDGVTPKQFEQFLQNYKPDETSLTEKHFKRLKAFSIFYTAYENAKTPKAGIHFLDTRGRYDFDDMIIFAIEVLKNEPTLLSELQEQFQYAMVDEFQDTNGAQLKLMSMLFSDRSSNICAVGDDDQSIFRFQGASVENFKIFLKLYPQSKSIVLKKNYRSQEGIIHVSTAFINLMDNQYRLADKKLEVMREKKTGPYVFSYKFKTIEEELTFLINEIKKIPEHDWNDTAVLVRTRKQAQDVIEGFLQSGLPYGTDGKEDIRGETRVKELMHILQLAKSDLSFEEKDLLLFEILLCDFWQIDYSDLILFLTNINLKKAQFRKKMKRISFKTELPYQIEGIQNRMEFPTEKQTPEMILKRSPSFFSELLLRFPAPSRVSAKEHEPPTIQETQELSICKNFHFRNPSALHQAAWAIGRLFTRAQHFPVFSLIMDFIQDSGMIDFILKKYQTNHVLRLRELRSISSCIENMKKANQGNPGITVNQYVKDLDQLERHNIPLAGEMVTKNQNGIKILTVHGSKGLEFKHVFIPFCVDSISWPKREKTALIPLPHELLIGQQTIQKEKINILYENDELRLFYVAATRAKDRLIFTAAPTEKHIISRFLTNAKLSPQEATYIPEEKIIIQFLKKFPKIDPLEFTQDIIYGLIEEMTLSPSSLNRYLNCPRQFFYYHLLKTPQPKKLSLVYGHCVHKTLEKTYRRFMKEGVFPPLSYFEEQFFQELDWQGVDQSMKQSCFTKFEHAKKWYQETFQIGPIKPLELERRLVKKMHNGLIFEGKFDKVDPIHGSNEVQVIDYKTGEPDKHIKAFQNFPDILSPDCDDYLRQLVAYKMLYENGYRRPRVKYGQLVFLDPVKKTVKKYSLQENTFINKSFPLSHTMVKDYEKLILQTWTKIKSLQFDRLPSYNKKKCGICPYTSICWK